jgi:hypothetical protein
LIFKGVDPWVDPWNVIFPAEVVIVARPVTETVEVFWGLSVCKILMSLLLESVELPLDNCWRRSRALAALGLAAGAPVSVDFFDELPPDESAFSSKARAAEYELKIAAATRILLA